MKPALWFGVPLLATACTGFVQDPPSGDSVPGVSSGSAGSGNSAGTTGKGGGSVSVDDIIGVDPETLPDEVPASSRVLRLTHAEYDRTVSDLLGLSVDTSKNFPEEQPNLGPYEGYAELGVNERLLNELSRAAEELAAQVVATPAAYQNLVGCVPDQPGCRDAFIDGFGLRALRRPLEPAEQARYRALFDEGQEVIESGDSFRDGVELVVTALLQSPKFLYRIERGAGADGAGTLLTDYEVASRLSYLFAGSMPDPALFSAAASGSLKGSAIAEQAARLVAEPRFAERALDFHERWMQLDELKSLTKDPLAYPAFSPELIASMRAETRRFIEDVVLTQGGTVNALLTSPVGYADARLAAVYGLPGSFGAELTQVQHDETSGRLGLFTQASFLAGHSSNSTGTSPILRGVFLLRRLACVEIADPPAGAQMQEPEQSPAEPILTTRQYFEWKTSMSACAGCHRAINPTGFAFEQFDGLGNLRTSEKGAPIDASGSVSIGDHTLTFANARELLAGLAELDQVRACYAKNWLQFAYGRAETRGDLRALGLATRDMKDASFSLGDLSISLTERLAFSHLPRLPE